MSMVARLRFTERNGGLPAAARLVSSVALPIALGAMGCGPPPDAQPPPTEDAAARVTAEKPEIRTLSETIDLAGAIVAEEQVTVYAKLTGYLQSLDVDIGDRVRKGQPLAVIEAPELTASLEEKKAALAEAEAAVEEAKAATGRHEADLEFRRATLARLQGIRQRDKDLLPLHDVEQAAAAAASAESLLRSAQARTRVAEAAVESRRAAWETMKRRAEYAEISAPIGGVVTERFVDPGALIQAASSSRTQAAPLVSLARIDRVRVVVDVPEAGAAFVKRGTPARIAVEGLEEIAGKVSRTAGALGAATRTLRAECDLPNAEGLLKPGMTARVTLELRQLKDAVTVPVEALQGEGVYVVEGGRAAYRGVVTGLQTGGRVQIVRGLSANDAVIREASAPLANDMPVAEGR